MNRLATALAAASEPGYLSAYNVVGTLGLALLLAGGAPLLARRQGWEGLPPWVQRLPAWALVVTAVAGLVALVVAYGVLY